ncbi:hypothetical protein PUNSTDRAFT_50363 [Punctularia strigosozonata HHB-11173 SS5]|uniref:uncharacterized protein n=1 Tax=Punctularia strigosozonata (strain HHB-11173) TaxID=741275 RepID=UPI00044183A0|nr:uncharacterized protein PUNSTDRAFT_50363 [Punctularia strigosozonata HHB-11173 SS5]EIN11303.1 hypothetical protein PUNSTDRAFT_50363 [Punctularia strigosozonata HHB-11173 SS5]
MTPVPYNGQAIEDDAFKVLITGFGPFANISQNPSWMAVKDLHNEVLVVDPTVEPVPVEPPAASLPPPPKRAPPPQGPLPPLGAKPEPPSDKMDTTPDPVPAPAPPPPPPPAPAPPRAPPSDPSSDPIPIEIDRDPRQIHITTHQVPVIYQHVLDEVPTMHTRPPTFKHMPELTPEIPAPEKGYDFVLHVGVAGRGPLRVERRGHKIGYLMKDITGELPPIVAKAELTDQEKVELAMAQRHRAANNLDEKEAKVAEVPNRGFGVGYEKMPAELETDINVPKLIHYIKESGMDEIYSSMDAGYYLCDFIYYCSLAEAQRAVAPSSNSPNHPETPDRPRPTKVLFLHVPPVGQPLSTEEVTETIKKIVIWVCSGLV